MRKLPVDAPVALYTIADGESIAMDDLVALNADGEAVAASDSEDINVIGYAFYVGESEVEVHTGIVSFANDTTDSVTRTMRGGCCFVADATTVCSESTNGVVAGIVVDVDDDEVFVDTSVVALATANILADMVALQDRVTDLES